MLIHWKPVLICSSISTFIIIISIIIFGNPFSIPQVNETQPVSHEGKTAHHSFSPTKPPTQDKVRDEKTPRGAQSSQNEVVPQKEFLQQQQVVPSDPTIGKDTASASNPQRSEVPKKADFYLYTDNGPVPWQFGVPYFNPPTWKIEFNPTLEELKQLDKIDQAINEPATPESRRAVLIAEREALIQRAQRPTKYISGAIITPGDDPGPTTVDWYNEYHQLHPEESP